MTSPARGPATAPATVSESIGIDIGGTKIASGFLRGEELLGRHLLPTPETGPEAVMDAVAAQIRSLQNQFGAAPVGIGVPGPLNTARTHVKFAPNIYNFNDVALVDGLCQRLPELARWVRLENDAKAAALAEARLGAGRGADSCVYVTISTGIGSGIVLGGKLWRGQHGIAGELGHVTALPGGPVSGTGQAGSLEALASGTAIARDASYALNRPVTTAEAFALAQQGHAIAGQVVGQAMQHIGIALANLQKILDPEVVVLGGGVTSVGDFFFAGVQQAANEYARGFAPVTLRRAQLGTDAGVIGAALAAREP